ncbi:stage II sporulation protein R [Aneurinibacillus aneurinilyticus]|jgi:stage II sporulation protein R|uniref:Stage II sporulation protein R n=1 Tax=Aneurinibacillus aneurinilyticus ATCC 12856 TaxID=649747 RepID=U1WWF1_ANEAE|nr:stage II sporulation protein R [Aneurinibacillus aneurinilyticus]ERI07005.1 stage II sporulation protein R [Aneurinibacillus aneurinilyticus ATCC 12856]MCI1695953.1 stage II sporulation protein R [Aneurinibacillus aneurinilyticus]MED0706356.1 stage II sporulation protein R [Aneurinibacillus aneurinilyticus]MED0723630.1 stage II sporulation protein R [Aneurinibacillus aneurinilyticus]MED0730688.1 stage II sporulation protein R [Aneurinibacillus aneurinilyticus]
MKKYYLLFFTLFLLVMSWESQKEALAVFTSNLVPEQSIRLRILANSDSPEDQQLKRQVRDRVIESVQTWAGEAESLQKARTVISNHLPELQQLVQETIKEKGYTYASHVELAQTDFPTKMYGTQVFPAGQYEAVRITIGNAEGKNWWCVLFPPLCFVDIASGDTAAHDKQKNTSQKSKDNNEIQVRFFLVELFHKLFT